MRSPDLVVDGPKLKKVREQRGLTQQELADLVGVDRTTIVGWESQNRKRQPAASNFKALCAALQVQDSELLMVTDGQAA